MKKKDVYVAPAVECYEIKFEGIPLMTSEPEAKRGTAGQDDTVNNYSGLL